MPPKKAVVSASVPASAVAEVPPSRGKAKAKASEDIPDVPTQEDPKPKPTPRGKAKAKASEDIPDVPTQEDQVTKPKPTPRGKAKAKVSEEMSDASVEEAKEPKKPQAKKNQSVSKEPICSESSDETTPKRGRGRPAKAKSDDSQVAPSTIKKKEPKPLEMKFSITASMIDEKKVVVLTKRKQSYVTDHIPTYEEMVDIYTNILNKLTPKPKLNPLAGAATTQAANSDEE